MSENREIANDWGWFPPYGGTPLSSDETIIVSEGVAYRATMQQMRRADGRGWVNIADAAHTEVSPQSITSGNRTLLTLDALGATTNYDYRDGIPTDVWSGDKFHAQASGETYMLRLTMIVDPATGASGNYLDLEVDIGSPIGQIYQTVTPLLKGAASRFSFAIPIFALNTFLANGAEFYVTSNVNCDIWGKALFIQRMSQP